MAQWLCSYLCWTSHCQRMQWHWTWPSTTLSSPTGVTSLGALSLRWWHGGHQLCLVSWNWCKLYSFTIVNVATYILYNWIALLRSSGLLNCAYVLYYTGSACMRCFIPSLLPALRESPPGGETSAAVNDEGDWHITPLTLCTKSLHGT